MPSGGCNIDPRVVRDVTYYLNPGHTARWVLKPDDDISLAIRHAHVVGANVIGVIARESYKPHWTDYTAARYYAKRYSDIDYIQLYNEPDQVGPSSWTRTPKQYMRAFNYWSQYFSNIIGPGLASGQTTWLNELIDLGFDIAEWRALCYHQYSDNTQELADQFLWYGMPTWITEWGVDLADDHEQAIQITRRLHELDQLSYMLESAIYFCASDAMVPSYGLTDESEAPLENYSAYFNGVS